MTAQLKVFVWRAQCGKTADPSQHHKPVPPPPSSQVATNLLRTNQTLLPSSVMSDQTSDQNCNDDSGSVSRTPVPTALDTSSSTPPQDVARLQNDLIPSPPASEASLRNGTSNTTSNAAFTNVDGSPRVYRFPNDLSPRFGGSSTDPGPNGRVVTVRDLRTKSCWICSEEDEDPPAARNQSSSISAPRPRRFVHPCNCTLVAHETCLLCWIDQSRRDHPLQDQVTCPQCKAPYILLSDKTTLLKTFEFFDKLITRAEPIGAVAFLGGSFLVACTTYGCVAIRMFLGKDAAKRALASPWPWHYWFEIPLIPFALIASRLNIFESAMTWVPTLVAFPISSIPIATATGAHGRLFDHYLESSLFNARAYPPGPALTALLVPWIRVFYLALKRRIYRAVLSPFHPSRRNDSSTQAQRARRRRVIVLGEPDSHILGDDEVADPNAILDDENGPMWQVQATVNQPAGTDNASDDGVTQTVYVSHYSLGRLCLGALSLPFVANLMGRLLARLARYSPLLAHFLGMKSAPSSSSSSILRSYYTTKSISTTTSKPPPSTSPSPFGSIYRGHLPILDGNYSGLSEAGKADKDEHKSVAERLTLLGYSPRYDDLDPVWWRNAVGTGLYILLVDAGSLLYRYMRLSQRKKTSIKDLPFQAGLVSGLDLRD